MFRIFKNFLETSECDEWIKKSPKFLGSYDFEDRTLDITNDPIVTKVKTFIEQKCECNLECDQAQIQLWAIGTNSPLHIHNDFGRTGGDYNSLLYLNDDFVGGEFFTKGLILKPEKGMLTFFDGSKIYHGVKKVQKKHRYSLIFWWKNTIFYNNN